MRDENLGFDTEEVYDSFEDERLVFFNEGEKEVFIYEDNVAIILSEIESFVDSCEKLKKSDLRVNNVSAKIRGLKDCFYELDIWIAAFDPRKKYSPNVEVFFSVVKEMGWLRSSPGREYKGTLNENILTNFDKIIYLIKDKLSSKGFKSKIYSVNKRLRENYSSCKRNVDALFESYSRLLVLRVDLSFLVHVDLIKAKELFDKFLNNRRSNKIFKNEVGYIWTLEHGDKKGYHYHCYFFFDGVHVRNDAYRAQLICEYWARITGAIGSSYNCNWEKGGYKYLAIGKIEHFDEDLRKNLMESLSYFFKRDQLLSIRFDQRVVRNYGYGFKAKYPRNRSGRPRKTLNISA